jgi:endonuclease YncB( thermonuclease family)
MFIFRKLLCCLSSSPDIINIKHSDVQYFSFEGYKTIAKLVSIYDGDTCTLIFNYHGKIVKHKCRIYGIDCPELAPNKDNKNREEEINKSIESRNEVIKLTTNIGYISDQLSKNDLQKMIDKNTKTINVECLNFDKYGRLLVKIFSNGVDIGKYMVCKKLAKEYYGGTKEEYKN